VALRTATSDFSTPNGFTLDMGVKLDRQTLVGAGANKWQHLIGKGDHGVRDGNAWTL
jgi:hypothetical protein